VRPRRTLIEIEIMCTSPPLITTVVTVPKKLAAVPQSKRLISLGETAHAKMFPAVVGTFSDARRVEPETRQSPCRPHNNREIFLSLYLSRLQSVGKRPMASTHIVYWKHYF
jgi:hypothetical protein